MLPVCLNPFKSCVGVWLCERAVASCLAFATMERRFPYLFRSNTLSKTNTLHEAAELGRVDKLQKFVDEGKNMGYPAR